jgi:hypothetical protein
MIIPYNIECRLWFEHIWGGGNHGLKFTLGYPMEFAISTKNQKRMTGTPKVPKL